MSRFLAIAVDASLYNTLGAFGAGGFSETFAGQICALLRGILYDTHSCGTLS